jgi:hypothetical protein
VDEIEVKVQERIAKAQIGFENRFADVEESVKKMIVDTIIKSYVFGQYDDEPTDCPVCGNIAVLSGTPEVMEWRAEYDREGNPENAYPIVELSGDSFKCNVCGLTLDSFEELEAAGVEILVPIEDVDPSDFYDDPFDGYDYYRDSRF